MSRWFRVYDDLIDDPKVQRLSGAVFKKKFFAALDGEQNEFSHLVAPCSGRPSSAEWSAIRARIFERDNYTCQYCGERGKKLECDHVYPVSRGGTHDDDNLKTACRSCNRNKRNKTVEEWLS